MGEEERERGREGEISITIKSTVLNALCTGSVLGESTEATVCFPPGPSGSFSLPVYVDYSLLGESCCHRGFPVCSHLPLG